MTGRIGIEWLHGRPHERQEEDEERAEAAALAVLESLNISPEAAHAAYMAQWLEYDDEAPMHGAALAWIAARDAADSAAVEGWHNPNAAGITIYL